MYFKQGIEILLVVYFRFIILIGVFNKDRRNFIYSGLGEK